MPVNFHQLIAANKRNSVLLAILFVLFIAALSGVFGYAFAPGNAQVILTVVVSAAILAVSMTGFSYFAGASTVLGISKARQIEKKDDPQLFNVVEELAIAAGIPMPKVYLIDDSAPNAFATGRDPAHGVVAITTGLRSKLSRDQLAGVMAHELAHIRNYDIRFGMLMAVLVGLVVLLCDMFRRMAFYGGLGGGRSRRSRSSGSSGGGGAVVLIIIVAAILLSIIAPIIAKVIQLAVSRQREYLADASAVELTRYPAGLAGALEKIAADKEVLEVANRATQHLYIINPIKPFEKRAALLFSTHPPVQERIARLRKLDRSAATSV